MVKQVSGQAVAWFGGWIMLIASIVTVAAVAIAWQIILPQISSTFQFVGDGTGKYDFAENAVILGLILITFTTIVNILGVRLMSRINNVGVIAELVGAVALIILLAVHATRGPDVVTETFGKGPGFRATTRSATAAAFLIGAIMPAYVMFGFDTAGSLAEETNDPRRRAPKAILMALGAAGVAGMLLLLFALMAAPDLHNPDVASGGLPYIVKSVLGDTLGDILLWDVVVAITVCCLAIHTASIRMMFSMARDNALPGSGYIAKVSEKSRTPIVPSIIVGLLAMLILLVNIRQTQIFTVITGVAIVMIYLAYLCVTTPLLLRRIGGWDGLKARRRAVLARWGRHPRERLRGRIRRAHGDQHRLAAHRDLRRRELPVGRHHLHRRRDRDRRRSTTPRSAGTASACWTRTALPSRGRARTPGVRGSLNRCRGRGRTCRASGLQGRAARARSSSPRSPVGASPAPQNGTCSRTSA